MKISTAVAGGGAVGPMLFLAHVVPWWEVCAPIVVSVGVLIYRLLAEGGRRKTLETTYRHAPGGTVVVLGEGPGGPLMWIRVGEGQRSELPINKQSRYRHRPSGCVYRAGGERRREGSARAHVDPA